MELGSSTAFAPGWVQKSEGIRTEMTGLKQKLNKLKE
jgi:hypothetical protein